MVGLALYFILYNWMLTMVHFKFDDKECNCLTFICMLGFSGSCPGPPV